MADQFQQPPLQPQQFQNSQNSNHYQSNQYSSRHQNPPKTPPSSGGRSKTSSRFSFRSPGSSSNHKHNKKESLVESPSEKAKQQMSAHTKANPNAAINEAQPIARALEKTTIAGLQNIQCTDIHGNLITDADRSNPTRWRMERPLETIRSFEYAIDRAYGGRQSTIFPNAPPGPPGFQSQRSSSYGAPGQDMRRYSSHGASRDDLSQMNPSDHGPTPPRHYASRSQFGGPPASSSSQWHNHSNSNQGNFGYAGSSRSRDNLTSGTHSSASEWANSTVPTSDNSSVHGHPVPPHHQSQYQSQYQNQHQNQSQQYQQEAEYEGYGAYMNDVFDESPQLPAKNNFSNNNGKARASPGLPPAPPAHTNYSNGPPRPPAKDTRPQQGKSTSTDQSHLPSPGEARQSWFKKRFSRGPK